MIFSADQKRCFGQIAFTGSLAIAGVFSQIALQDSRIAKIAQGCILVNTGYGILKKSLENNSHPSHSHLKRIYHVASLVLGTAAIGYGMYCLLQGVSEFYSFNNVIELEDQIGKNRELLLLQPNSQSDRSSCSKDDTFINLNSDDLQIIEKTEKVLETKSSIFKTPWGEIFEGDFSKIICSDPHNNGILVKAQSRLLNCPEGKKLWENVLEEGDFTIECAEPEELYGSHGITWIEPRRILVSNQPGNHLSTLTFELNNLKQAKRALSIAERKCEMSKYDFANSYEILEYESAKETARIANDCVKNGFWPQYFSQEVKDLDSHLKEQQLLGHTNFYYGVHEESCKKYPTRN